MKAIRHTGILLSALLLAACQNMAPAPVVERAKPAQPVAAAKDVYTVKKGDTLYSIAQAHGIDHRELAGLNNIENPARIHVGQQLRLRPAAAQAAAGEAVAQPIGGGAPAVEERPLDGSPAATPPGNAAAASSPQMKSEPKAGKLPYSDEALALAQREQSAAGAGAGAGAGAVVAKAEPKPEVKPEARPEPRPAVGADDVAWGWPANGAVVGEYAEPASKGLSFGGKLGDPVFAAAAGKVIFAGQGPRGYGKLVIVKHNATYISAYGHNDKLHVKEGQNVSKGERIADMGNSDAERVKLYFEIRRQSTPVDPAKLLPQR